MGDNPENPMVDPKGDTDPVSGVDQPKTADGGAHVNPGNETNDQLLADKTHLEAQDRELERQIAILRADNEKLLNERRETETRVDEWRKALGVSPGDDPTATIKDLGQRRDEDLARIVQLQTALGIGTGDDPERAVDALKARGEGGNVEDLSGLPIYGHLLLMTNLAKISGLAGYQGCPDTLYPGGGDEWYSSIENVQGEDGRYVQQIVVGVRYGQFQHQDALIAHRELEADLADALKGQKTARVQLDRLKGGRRDPVAEKAYQDKFDDLGDKVADLRRRIEAVKPRLERPEGQTWRFSGTLETFGQESETAAH